MKLLLPPNALYRLGGCLLPGANEFVLLGKNGSLWHCGLDGDTVTELGTITSEGTHTDSDCGIISLAFDPL